MSLVLHLANLVAAVAPHRELLGVRRALLRLGGIRCGSGTRITNQVGVHGRHLRLGRNVFVGAGTTFHSCPQGPIDIGDNVALAPRCLIASGTHQIGPPDARAGTDCGYPIRIGDGCWIGAGTTILGGADIAAGSIVAAGAVVRPGSYPGNALLAGVPAVVKRVLSASEKAMSLR